MAASKGTVHFDRFADIAEEPRKLLQPIEGYKDLKLVSLEKAIEPIEKFCPDVRRRAYIAKENCDQPKDGLTEDESASIFLYTTEWAPREQCLYVVLNGVLRSKNRSRLITPWLFYLKLLLTALFRLKPCSMTIWRGVPLDLRNDYEVGKTYTWWGFSSCTKSLAVLESDLFLGQEGKRTMFSMECFNGRKIRAHSSIEEEDEILLLPGTQFIVEGHLKPSKKDPDLIIIQVKQVEPPYPLLEEPSPGITIAKSMTSLSISTSDNPSNFDKPIKPKPSPTSVEPKPYIVKQDPPIPIKVKQEPQEFDLSAKMFCDGRPCAKCKKCRDWHFDGDDKTWRWICDYNNWKDADYNRWGSAYVYARFTRRDRATCGSGGDVYDGHLGSGSSVFGHVCLCEKH